MNTCIPAAGTSLTRRIAIAGIVGPPFFVMVLLLLGFVKSGFNPIIQAGSEESIGDLGWVQIANFLITGVCFAILAIGLWLGFGDRLSGRIGSALIAAAGIGLVGAGLFVTDPGYGVVTIHGNLHIAASLMVFLSLLIACFVYARRFWSNRGFALYSMASGLVIPASLIAAHNIEAWPGLIQRVMITLVWTWITVLAIRLYTSNGKP